MPPKNGKGAVKLLTPAKTSSDTKIQVCPVCEDVRVDASTSKKGQESIFCEGPCGSWLHRHCAGLSKVVFASISKSTDNIFGLPCRLRQNENELGGLRQRIVDLECKLDALLTKSILGSPSSESRASELLTGASGADKGGAMQPLHDQPSSRPPPDMSRRFNVIIYGVGECSKSSTRAYRQNEDLKKVISVLSPLDSSINHQSIKDLFRLGKFNANQMKPRPIMVKLIRSADVTSILSKVGQLSYPYFIKPDRSLEERRKERFLMEVRWSLIQTGIKRKCIKIKNSALFINNNKLGMVDSSTHFSMWALIRVVVFPVLIHLPYLLVRWSLGRICQLAVLSTQYFLPPLTNLGSVRLVQPPSNLTHLLQSVKRLYFSLCLQTHALHPHPNPTVQVTDLDPQ